MKKTLENFIRKTSFGFTRFHSYFGKHAFLYALILLATFNLQLSTASAQQEALDSLYSIWQDKTQSDSVRVDAYKTYIWDGFLFSKPDSAFSLAEGLMGFGREHNFPEAEALGLKIQGVSWYARADYPQALDYYGRSLAIQEQIGNQKGIANSLGNIGIIYQNQGDYPKALDYHGRSLAIREQIGDQYLIAISLNNIGVIYINQGDYPKAMDYYSRSLAIQEQIGDQKGIAASLNNIGNIYQNQGDYPKALNYYGRSLAIREQIGDQNGIAGSLGNIGSIYNNLGEYPKALDYYGRSLAIQEQIGNQKGIAASLNNIGAVYRNQGDYTKAMDYYSRSLAIKEQIGDQNGIAGSLNNIGLIYQTQGDYTKALKHCNEGYTLAQATGALHVQRDGCKCLYDTYKAMGKSNNALVYLEKMQVIDDSLNAEETSKKLQQMEFAKAMLADSLEQVAKDLEVQNTHKEEVRKKNRTRNIAIGSGLFLLLLAGGLYSRNRYIKKAKDVIEHEKDRSDNLLLNILPAEIAEELKTKGEAAARDFDQVSILFTDFQAFTKLSEQMSPQDLVAEMNHCFKAFDAVCEKYSIEKIKTIGDSYMAAGGLPIPDSNAAKNTVMAGIEMAQFVVDRKQEREALDLIPFEMRTGIHTGNVVAGIIGVKKFQYDIWGDTVNTASRMESAGVVGKVNISESTYELIKDEKDFKFESRGKIEAKGKGAVEMWFVQHSA